ncbi:serine palmitoyltransferase [Ferruginivarius sediminum]|uniref:Aminotransferase class I/II-fold pyridoxal phosphate-dependent enzyme n=1 Tax=Ferruginivarius sediminum TaxID=2661937 RepID=A0A369T678_9PROT|nr:aminotransferase class I/II-fold pyridoxal phosphate-dependent enzyme [Ferruginivarius sediminum]RDD60833.1 aminotransferase class I/II-fold pyridoxal phosphate-dependent enzyme [Ferruginivarius sediminum]
MADLFDKFQYIRQAHAQMVEAAGGDPLGVRVERILSPTEAEVGGRRCVLLGSNNYLGLTFDPDAIEAACAALRTSGTGTTGSRVANGSYASHQDLERQLAGFFGRRHAILFTTGYQANVGFLSAIAGKDDTILIDSDSHASIYDGCKLGDATVLRFKHNDAADLERRLRRLPAGSNKLVVLEGIYSMLGDRAPLADLVAAAKAHDAYILLDEAHSLGVLGEGGRGLAAEVGVEDQIDFLIGTFSKSVGTIGGFCVSNHPELEAVRLAARAYLFTASLPPSIVASASATLERIRTDASLRERLWRNTDIVYDGLKDLGYTVGPDKTPVIGVKMPDAEVGLVVWHTLMQHGVYVNLALPPATPQGTCLLRCSVCAAHTREQLQTVLDGFEAARAVLADQGAKVRAAE